MLSKKDNLEKSVQYQLHKNQVDFKSFNLSCYDSSRTFRNGDRALQRHSVIIGKTASFSKIQNYIWIQHLKYEHPYLKILKLSYFDFSKTRIHNKS